MSEKMKAIELFAGVGGFHLGVKENFDVVWANQWEPNKKNQHAFDCYKSHFPETISVNEDISTVNLSTIPEHDLLMGGFPCQDYSVATTKSQGIQGKKGVLFWEIKRVLEAKRPSFVLLENVDRLVKSPTKQRGRDFGIMLKVFSDLGYVVEWRIVKASDYGYPQKRTRIFIYATKKDEQKTNYKDIETYKEKSLFNQVFPVTGEEHQKHKPVEGEIGNLDLQQVSDNFQMTFRNSGYMIDGFIYTEENTPKKRKEKPLKEIMEENVDEKYILNEETYEKWKYLKGAKKIPRKTKEGFEYTYSEGAMAFPDDINKPGRTMLTSESTKNRSSHVVPVLGTDKLRVITPVEAERLNGFPDEWTNTGMPEKTRYFCMGNALVVGLIKEISDEIYKRS